MDLRRRHNLGSDLFAGPQGSDQVVTIEFRFPSSSADGDKLNPADIEVTIHTSDEAQLVAPVSIIVSVTGGTAVLGFDYNFTPTTLNFDIGANDGHILSAVADILAANTPVCTVIFGLSNVSGATILGNTVHTLTLTGSGGA